MAWATARPDTEALTGPIQNLFSTSHTAYDARTSLCLAQMNARNMHELKRKVRSTDRPRPPFGTEDASSFDYNVARNKALTALRAARRQERGDGISRAQGRHASAGRRAPVFQRLFDDATLKRRSLAAREAQVPAECTFRPRIHGGGASSLRAAHPVLPRSGPPRLPGPHVTEMANARMQALMAQRKRRRGEENARFRRASASVSTKSAMARIAHKFYHLVHDRTSMRRVRDIFMDCDADGNGRVDKAELTKALPMLGVHVTAQELDAAWPIFDRDGNGTIDHLELEEIVRMHQNQLWSAERADRDGLGRGARPSTQISGTRQPSARRPSTSHGGSARSERPGSVGGSSCASSYMNGSDWTWETCSQVSSRAPSLSGF